MCPLGKTNASELARSFGARKETDQPARQLPVLLRAHELLQCRSWKRHLNEAVPFPNSPWARYKSRWQRPPSAEMNCGCWTVVCPQMQEAFSQAPASRAVNGAAGCYPRCGPWWCPAEGGCCLGAGSAGLPSAPGLLVLAWPCPCRCAQWSADGKALALVGRQSCTLSGGPAVTKTSSGFREGGFRSNGASHKLSNGTRTLWRSLSKALLPGRRSPDHVSADLGRATKLLQPELGRNPKPTRPPGASAPRWSPSGPGGPAGQGWVASPAQGCGPRRLEMVCDELSMKPPWARAQHRDAEVQPESSRRKRSCLCEEARGRLDRSEPGSGPDATSGSPQPQA